MILLPALWSVMARWLLGASLRAAVLAVVGLAITTALRGRLRPGWVYGLWLVVFVPLVLPWTPASRLSPYGWMPPAVVAGGPVPAPVKAPAAGTGGGATPLAQRSGASSTGGGSRARPAADRTTARAGVGGGGSGVARLWVALGGGWLAGVLYFGDVMAVWGASGGGVRGGPSLWEAPDLRGPVLAGVLRPRVVLPRGLGDGHDSDRGIR